MGKRLRNNGRRIAVVMVVLSVSGCNHTALAASSKPKRPKAATSSSKRKEAQRIQNRLDDLYDQMSALAEDANQAQVNLSEALNESKDAKELAADTSAAYDRQLAIAVEGVRRRYVAGQTRSVDVGLSLQDNSRRTMYLSLSRGRVNDTVDALSAAKQDRDRDRGRAAEVAKRAAAERKRAKDSLAKAEQLSVEEETLLSQVESEVAQLLVVEEKQRQDEEAARARSAEKKRKAAALAELERRRIARAKEEAASLASKGRRPGLAEPKSSGKKKQILKSPVGQRNADPADPEAGESDAELAAAAGESSAVPTSPGAATAIATAKAQLGKSYVWGASGAFTFDCSGLMLYSWRAAGTALPRVSRAQYSATRRVSRDQLQPGDLLFFAKPGRPIHHVGMYLGDGLMIEAPHRGAKVRIRSAWRRDYLGAGRVG